MLSRSQRWAGKEAKGRDSVVLKSELYRHKTGAIDPNLVRCTIHLATLSCLEIRNKDVQHACVSRAHRSAKTTSSSCLAWIVDLRMYNTHVPRERIVPRKRLSTRYINHGGSFACDCYGSCLRARWDRTSARKQCCMACWLKGWYAHI